MTKIKFIIASIFTVIILAACSANFDETNRPEASPTPTPFSIIIGETSKPAPSASPSAPPVANSESPRYNEYNVNLEYYPDEGNIAVVERIKYKNKTGSTLEKIYLNVYLNAFAEDAEYKPYFESFEKKIFSSGLDYSRLTMLGIIAEKEELEYDLSGTVLTVKLNKPLEPDSMLELVLSFEAYIPKINHRTGRNDHAAWFGNFLPVLAVYDENGWHSEQYYPAGDPFYSESSNYNVKITVPAGYTVVGSGEESTSELGGKCITTISAKMVRDFAFAVSSEFRIESAKTDSGAYVNLYYYSDQPDVSRVLQTASDSIDHYGKRIAAYPFTSFDIVETGMFLQGGMEYPELVFIDSAYFTASGFYDSLTHEIGHQWFYNIIGNNQIKEAWLDEGLTMYVQQAILYDNNEIDEKMKADYIALAEKLKTLENKTLQTDISVYTSWGDYYAINYSRAKLMFCSLANKIGGDKFDAFLKLYYNRCSFGTANKQTLIAIAEEASGISLGDFFSAWMGDYTLPPLDQRKQ